MADATTGSTYDVVNLVGPLFLLDPDDTPFLAMAGGLNGGKNAGTPIHTWQTQTVNAGAAVSGIAEGVDPTVAVKSRVEVSNVTQIFNPAVQVTYTKQSAVNRLGDYAADRGWSVLGNQPIQNEIANQLALATMETARDVDWAMLNGTYQLPTDNTTGRQMRGILTAISSNDETTVAVGANWTFDFTGGAADDLWTTSAAHGLSTGDEIQFIVAGSAAPAEFVIDTSYYAIVASTTTLQLASTKANALAGTQIQGTADSSGNYTAKKHRALTKTLIDDLMQSVYDNGGLRGGSRPVFFCNSYNKRQFSNIYGYAPTDRTMGGVNIGNVMTDFRDNVAIVVDQNIPTDTVLLADMSEVVPVALPYPGKGNFFAEELAKTGPKEDWMIYGDIGLEYGAEQHHGKITDLTTVA